ncbi:MAG: CRISPR-associated protein Csx11 [Thermodesulfobacteriota bacterium]
MSDFLQKLKDNRVPILLAEIGAYLHDLGKARKKFIEHYTQNGGSGWDGHNFPSVFPDNLKNLLYQCTVNICNESAILLDFIEKHHKEKERNSNLNDCDCEIPKLIRLLYAGWNGYDGMDSGLDKGNASKKQLKDKIFISTAFGYEPEESRIKDADKITKDLFKVVEDALNEYKDNKDILKLRDSLIGNTRNFYQKFLGETRRSANDVTLWDHSYSVATLFKCAIAKNILDYSNASFDPLDFSWKILSVNLDTLSIIAKAIKVGDVLGYEEKINDAFNMVKRLIEEEYPLGNEIYRDTSGIFFLIPNIEIEELKAVILSKLKEIEPELMPAIISKEIIAQQPDNYKFDCDNQQQIPSNIKNRRDQFEKDKRESLLKAFPEIKQIAHQEISYPTSSERFFSDKFADNWNNREVCPICRLRPMKENSDGCEHCLQRRKNQAENWIKNPKQTIWLDEVSDHNDRVSLILGCFTLDKWLDGSFVKTMAIKKENSPIPKNPSPARIRRCWETTQRFINSTVFNKTLKNYNWGQEPRTKRIEFIINPNPNIPKGSTCDIDIDGLRLSPVCIDKNQGVFITTVNLELLSNKGKTVEHISMCMQRKNIKVKKEASNKWELGFKISSAKPANTEFQNYLPYVKIYDFPDQFMALVPAYDALNIAKRIVEEYEVQFSKVRDRLPLHIGVIAFQRRTPLYVAMDGGKRLINAFKANSKTINAKVDSISDVHNSNLGKYVKELTIKLDPCYSSVPLTWKISYSTGDPGQQDEWHPYIRFDGNSPNRGNYSFDYTGNGDYVVHVKELRLNDSIKIETAYFKLAYLEIPADRFRIDEKLRPLDGIKRLDELWNDIKHILKSKNLGISQIYAYWQEVKKRYENNKGDSVWKDFVKSSLINILQVSPQKDRGLFDKLFQATKDDLLDLCLHWNFQVRKIKPEREEVKT